MTLRVDVAGAVGGKIHLLEASMVGSEVFFEGGLIDNNLKVFLFFCFFFVFCFLFFVFCFLFFYLCVLIVKIINPSFFSDLPLST